MTVDKSKYIVIPQWLLSLIIAVTTVAAGMWVSKAVSETRISRNETEIEKLRQEKVSKDEFSLVLDRLNTIEKKLDGIKRNE